MAKLLDPGRQFTDGTTLAPVAAGAAYFDSNGTTSTKAVYSDAALSTPISQPIELDTEGRLPDPVYGSGSYTVRVYDSTDTGSRDGALVFSENDIGPGDASSITYDQGGTGSVATTVAVKLAQAGVSVADFGGDKTGATDSRAAIQSAVTATAAGGTLLFPDGTWLVDVDTTITLSNPIKIVLSAGATIKASASTLIGLVTDEDDQFVFTADNVDGIRIEGGAFNGNKGAATNPYAGLLKTTRCSDVHVSRMHHYDVDNIYGVVSIDSYNGSVNELVQDVSYCDNLVERCAEGFWWRNSVQGIVAERNTFRDMDIQDPIAGATRHGTTQYFGRAIRGSGYVQSTSADGDIGDIRIRANIVDGATYGVEIWNQDATNGRNPDNAKNVTISDNNIRALFGIGLNSWSDFSIGANSVEYLPLTSAQMAAYSGTTHITDTSATYNSAGAMIEARPGYGGSVTGNTLDGHYTASGTDYTSATLGLAFGVSDKDIKCEIVASGNNIRRCYIGMSGQECTNTLIAANTVTECRQAMVTAAGGTNTNGYTGNAFTGNIIRALTKTLSNQVTVDLYGSWRVAGNDFMGSVSDPQNTPHLRLRDTAEDYWVQNNNFTYFLSAAIYDLASATTYSGNSYDCGVGVATATVSAMIRFTRVNLKTAKISNEHAVSVAYAWEWDDTAGASTDSYEAGWVWIYSDITAMNRKVTGTAAYDLFAIGGHRAAAPTTGTRWSAGQIVFDETPSASGKIGWVCTASGTPGTWKPWGAIDA